MLQKSSNKKSGEREVALKNFAPFTITLRSKAMANQTRVMCETTVNSTKGYIKVCA
ncbi:unnamed protein product, partial [Gulo gulo]